MYLKIKNWSKRAKQQSKIKTRVSEKKRRTKAKDNPQKLFVARIDTS